MNITMNLYYKGKEGNARKFVEEMGVSGTTARIRAETGNERYQNFLPFGDQETVLLIDRWTDQVAIDVHHKSEMMQMIASLREKYDLHMRAERYVSDDGGIPSGDTAFIRE